MINKLLDIMNESKNLEEFKSALLKDGFKTVDFIHNNDDWSTMVVATYRNSDIGKLIMIINPKESTTLDY